MLEIYGYLAMPHNVSKLIGGVGYPITKAALVEKFGDYQIKVSENAEILFSDLMKNIRTETFQTATSLYCALITIM